jgi:hypothetical protein
MSVCSPRRFHPRSLAIVGQAVLLAFALTAALPGAAFAQGDDDTHFGVGVSFAPNWKSRNDMLATIGLEEDSGSFEGSEFTIGFVRGRTLGGDWGVSYVRKPFKDTSQTSSSSDSGSCGTGCTFSNSQTVTTTFNDVYLRGIEVHFAPVFVTIADRVQIGMHIAGGIAVPEGTIDETFAFTSSSTFQGQTFTDTFSDSSTSPAKDVLFSKIPLFKVEVQGAVILAPGLKLKVSGGLNNPGMGVRVGAVYLFGAN